MRPFREQLTVRGVLIGILGSVIITASSLYVALKLGALPWPVFFVALFALFLLKAIGSCRWGKSGAHPTNINEVNVTHTAMSAGAMVAGGLAFSIPAVYLLFPDAQLPLSTVLVCALVGVALGLVYTLLIRRYFVEESGMTFPIGTAAAETLIAATQGGGKAGILFTSMGVSGLFAALRDLFGAIPAMLFSNVAIPGVSFGVYSSLMTMGVGLMIGPVAVLVWFLGGLLGNFGLVTGASALGLWDVAAGCDIRTSLGIGLMVGCGVGIIGKVIIPFARSTVALLRSNRRDKDGDAATDDAQGSRELARVFKWMPLVVAAIMLVCTFALGLGLLPSLVLVLGTWIAVSLAAQSVGQAGINPMEVFGILMLLLVTALFSLGQLEGLLVVAIVAVACGLAGDVMNDFKAGHILKSNPKAQWISEAIGAFVGAFVAAGVIALIVAAYGPDCFGLGHEFVAVQASAVATMLGGIPHLGAFLIGLAAGAILYLLGAPILMLGLGIYLPFYLTLTVAIGGLVGFVIKRLPFEWAKGNDPIIAASGLLGGESIVGVITAFIAVASGVTLL